MAARHRVKRKPVDPPSRIKVKDPKHPFEKADSSVNASDVMWWKADEGHIHDRVFSVADEIARHASGNRISHAMYARAYDDSSIPGYGVPNGALAAWMPFNGGVTFNVIASCTDAATSKIAKSKPRVQLVPNGGSGRVKRLCKKLNMYLDGLFELSDAYVAAQLAFLHSCIFGTGCVKVYYDQHGDFHCDTVMIDDVLIDRIDGRYGDPRQMHQLSPVDRQVLLQQFPEFKAEIKACSNVTRGTYVGRTTLDDVMVLESWHLPSGPDAKDGRHTICIQGADLFVEEWKHSFFPFLFCRWKESFGFFGSGIAKSLMGKSQEINKLLRWISQAQAMACMPRVFLDSRSQVNKDHLQKVGGVITFTGNPPVFNTAPGMSPEVYEHLRWLIQSCYESEGISQLSAQSQKPPGLNSGVAMREYHDIETERFALVAQRWERLFLDMARAMVALTRDIAVDHPDLAVKTKGHRFVQTIKWSEVDLDDSEYELQLWPESQLPRTPEGRLQSIEELIQAGWLDRTTAMDLLDMPDLSAVNARLTAALDRINADIDSMLEDGKPKRPDQFIDLNLALTICKQEINMARAKASEPEDRIELLVDYANECVQQIQATQPPAPPQAQPSPTGKPGQPPVAELAQTAPQQ